MNKFLNKFKGWALGRGGAATALTVLAVLTIMFVNAILYSLTTAYGWYLYEPAKVTEPLSGSTDRIFEGVDDEVTIVFLREESDMVSDSVSSAVYQTAKALEERHDFINLEFVNFYTHRYYDDESGQEKVFPIDRYKKDMRGEDISGLSEWAIIFIVGDADSTTGAYHVLPSTSYSSLFSFDSEGTIYAYNGEEVLASMICWVLADEHPVAYITVGHGETIDPAFTNMLTCAGYYLDLIDLSKKEVPEDAGVLVISNPISDFEYSVDGSVRTEIDRLNDYIDDRGGDVYISIDSSLGRKLPAFETFLEERGFILAAREQGGIYSREVVKDPANATSTDGYRFIVEYADNVISSDIRRAVTESGVDTKIEVKSMGRIIIPEGSTAVPVLVASSSAETYAGGVKCDSEGGYAVCAINDLPSAGNTRSRIFLCYGSYLTSSAAMVTNSYSNKDFMFSLMSYGFGAPISPIGCADLVFVSETLTGFTMSNARAFTAIILAIPAVIGVVGAVIVIRRKHR